MLQVLIANCYGRRLGSVEIAINQVTKEVIFRGDATLSEPAELRLPYQVRKINLNSLKSLQTKKVK